MTDILIGTPGSVQRDIATRMDKDTIPAAVPPSRLFDMAVRGAIAQLAYDLWQDHGCPIGSAENDWLEAERKVLEQRSVGSQT